MKKTKVTKSGAHCAAIVGVCAWAATATAQTLATPGAALNRFEPSDTGSDWFANESLDMRGTVRPAFGVVGDYAYKPYVLNNPDGSENTAIIASQFYLHLGASLVLFDRLRLAMSLPIALEQSGTSKTVGSEMYVAPSSGGVGDLRFGADLRLFGEYGDAATMALGVRAWAPTGDASQYLGDGKARVGPRLSIAGDIAAFAYAASLGAIYRANDTPFDGHPTGTEVDFNVAAGVRLANKALLLGPELQGSTIVSQGSVVFQNRTTPAELILGGHYNAGDVRFGLGAGPGLSNAAGTAQFRALASLEWMPAIERPQPPPSDRDLDGVADQDDACPDVAGERTSDAATNGCPRPPPPAPAPTPPPPPPDRDGDGVLDLDDACPDVAGVKTDDPKTNGCPSDRDKDGIADVDDACPDFAGPRSADPKKNGCPLVRVEAGHVKILEQIKFKTNSAEIVDSQPIIDAVRATIREHPEIKHLRVQGYTDNVGSAAHNKELSTRRAASVRAALIKAGLNPHELSSEGFGLERPIEDNGTEEGRAANRRVEFLIEDLATTAPEPTTATPGTKAPKSAPPPSKP
jgi:outer membrane protein OmpA-like peptidoglycan-associated protein